VFQLCWDTFFLEKGLTAALLDRYAFGSLRFWIALLLDKKRSKTNKIQEARQKDVRALRYWTALLLDRFAVRN